MRRRAGRLLPLLGLTLGCSGLMPALTSPAQGGPPWTEVTSEHFVVWTDLDPAEGREALAAFEGIYTALEDTAFPSSGGRPSPMNIVFFAREKDYYQFAPEATTALFVPALPNDLDEVATMLMFGGLVEQTRLTFQHELTHVFIRQSLGWAPPWLHEGLAEYYSTLRVDDGFVYVGEPLPHRGISLGPDWRIDKSGSWSRQLIPMRYVPTVRRLVRADSTAFYAWAGGGLELGARERQAAFYCGAWGLVHLLLNGPAGYRRRFSGYLDALAHGEREREAWWRAFGDVPAKQLEESYRTHMRWTEMLSATVHRARYEPRALSPPRVRTMAAAEVHLLWARLRPWVPLNADVVRADLDAAGAYAPGSPDVHFWKGRFLATSGRLSEAERELRAAVAARAGAPLYLLGLAKLYRGWVDEKTKEIRYPARLAETVAQLAKVATSANALDTVAAFHAEEGGRESALKGVEFAVRAVRADPACFRCLDTHARLLFALGRAKDALAVQEHAMTLVPQTASVPDMVGRLREYRKALRDADRAPAGPAVPSRPPSPSRSHEDVIERLKRGG
jgi:tetratricopeptide (TPR) repeat protein